MRVVLKRNMIELVSYGNKMSLPSNTKSESSIIASIKNFAKSFIL